MNLFKRIKLYRDYKKVIRQNKVSLEANYSIRIDRAHRMYTVLNIPEENYGEPYNLRKADIETISERFVKDYINQVSSYLNQIGLSEMYDFYEPVKKVDKYSYLIILGFKHINSVNYNKIIWYRLIPIITSLSLVSLILYFILG